MNNLNTEVMYRNYERSLRPNPLNEPEHRFVHSKQMQDGTCAMKEGRNCQQDNN